MLADRVRMSRLLDVAVGVKPEDIADENCKVATDADFSGTTNGGFRYIGTETRLVIPHVIKGVQVTSYSSMFEFSNVTEVRSNNPNITNMNSMFAYSQATSLDLSSFDTSKVTNMSEMFRNSKATSLNLSSFDTSNVTTMSNMFYYSSATTLDLSSFDTSNVTSMSYMFYYSSATTLDLSSFDTSNVTTMSNMFRGTSATIGYARTQADADKFNASSGKPPGLVFVVK